MSDRDDPVTRRAQTRVGSVLRGKWRLDRLIGVGGMASVYEATHRNGKRGAVKLLHSEISLDRDARERFLREGYVANKVEHPGVVSVLDDDETEDGGVFLVMELLEGQSVESLRESRPGKRLELGEVLAIADQLLDVLAAAHAKGIVHRDLKPENLFLCRPRGGHSDGVALGQVKVLDFGIARLRETQGSATATRTGSMMGTPAFMPPEQALGQWNDVDARTDIWAVGATIFALVTGRTVHVADSVNKLLLAAMTAHAPPLASVLPSVSPAIAGVVDCALSFEQARRWPTAQAMREALRAASTVPGATLSHAVAARTAAPSPPIPSAPSVPTSSVTGQTAFPVSATVGKRPRSNGGIVAAGVVVTLVVVGGGAFALLRPGSSPEASGSEPRPEAVNVAAPTIDSATPTTPTVEPSPPPADTSAASASAAPPASASAAAPQAPAATGATTTAIAKPPAATPRPASPRPGAPTKPASTNPLDKW